MMTGFKFILQKKKAVVLLKARKINRKRTAAAVKNQMSPPGINILT